MIRPGVREYFRLRPGEDRVGKQVEEEISFHIEERARRLMTLGYSYEAARAEAERRFGPLERARLTLQHSAAQRERRMSIREWLSEWREDVSYSARSLGREPLVSLVIIVTLALGIGANATMFGIVDQLLLRGPAHVVDPGSVHRLYVTQKDWSGNEGTTSYAGYITYTTLRDKATTLSGVAAYRELPARIGKGESAAEENAGWATPDLFTLLGVKPLLGRFFTADENRPHNARRVAVLDYGYWHAKLGGSREVIGRTIDIADEAYTIIGVAPKGFTGPELKPVSLWLPFNTGYEPHPEWETTFNASWFHIAVRLKQGVTPEAAGAQATRLYQAAAHGVNEAAEKGRLSIRPMHFDEEGEETAEVSVARWLGGVSVIVLLVASANVLNLLLARAVRRRREISVRLAMGISRGRLIRLPFSESVLLSVGGLLAALVLAYWGGQFLRKALLPDVLWGSPIDSHVLTFSAAVTILTALVIGLAPALQALSLDLTATLRATSRQGGGTTNRGLRDALTVMQAALSLVLLIGAGLFVRSLDRAAHAPLGIDLQRVLSVWPMFPPAATPTPQQREADNARRRTTLAAAAAQLRARGDVEHATLALGTPFQGGLGVPLIVPGLDSIPTLPDGGPYITVGDAHYFQTVGTRILRGRGFRNGDGAGSERVVVVSQTMANTLWPGADALTKCLIIDERANGPCSRVIGIAEDAHRNGVKKEALLQYYIPLGQEKSVSGTQLLVRPRGDAAAFANALRRELFAAIPEASFFKITLLQDRIDPQMRPWRLGATMFLIFGVLALLIAGIGLFSVIAYNVAQRRTEVGIRMVLGARRSGIIGLVLSRVMLLAVAGTLIGILLALLTGRYLEPLLFDTSARDFITFATVSVLLLITAFIAGLVPAARAGAVEPSVALRAE